MAAIVGGFVVHNWRAMFVGFLLGAVVGVAFPFACREAIAIAGEAAAFVRKNPGGLTSWPNRTLETIALILFVGAIVLAFRLGGFLKKIWSSWRSGLVSGIAVIWFLASAVSFAFFNSNKSPLYFFWLSAGLLGTVLIIIRNQNLDAGAEADSEADPDNPIKTAEQDILNRGSVVNSIVRAVIDDRSSVIAVTGAFGDGKSSVLNLLASALEQRTDVVCVRFSSWLPTDEKTLVSTLLSTVLAEIETRLFIPKIKRDLLAVTRLFFASLPRVPSPLIDLVAKPSQDQQLRELRSHLTKLPIRVAVLLDDMDRMRRKELDVLFKLLRGVPEFPQFTYVCAFHRGSLAEIVRGDDSSKGREEAERFLEKFFPEEIGLPGIEDARLAVEFEKRFYAICDRNNLLIRPEERAKFKDDFRILWHRHLKGYFSNLRRLKLFCNRLTRSLPIIGQEVNLLDFVLLEMVRVMDPVLYEEIFRNARYFIFARWRMSAWLDVVHPDEMEESKIRKDYFDILFGDVQGSSRGTVLALLGEVFPAVKSYVEGDTSGSMTEDAEMAEQERRVYHPDFFPRYFIFNVPADLFGEVELLAFINAMNSEKELSRCIGVVVSKYAELQDLPMKRWDFLHRVKLKIKSFNPVATQALATATAQLSDKLEQAEAAGAFDAMTGLSIVFVAANELGTTTGTQWVLEEAIREASSDIFATRVLNECISNDMRLLRDKSAIFKDQLETVFRERMFAKYGSLSERPPFFSAAGNSAQLASLGRWALCGPEGKEQVYKYLLREFRSEPANIGRFVRQFFPLVDGPPGADSLTAMAIYFPIDELKTLSDEYGGLAVSSSEESEAIEQFRALVTASEKRGDSVGEPRDPAEADSELPSEA